MNTLEEAFRALNLVESENEYAEMVAEEVLASTKCRDSKEDVIEWLTYDSSYDNEEEIDEIEEAYYKADRLIRSKLPNVKEWHTIIGKRPGEGDFGAAWNILAITDDDMIYGFWGESRGIWIFAGESDIDKLKDVISYYPEYAEYKLGVIPFEI